MEYCNIIWAAGSNISLTMLFIKQKKAIRIILHSKWNAHTALIFTRLRILTLYDINKFQSCCFVYKSLNRLLPPSFCDIFDINYDIHDHNTRHKSDIHAIAHRIHARTMYIKVYGAKLWNSLHQFLKNSNSYRQFKNYYKIYILNNQTDS